MYLAFNGSGSGHYDAVLGENNETGSHSLTTESEERKAGCTCGKNSGKNDTKSSCADYGLTYKSRCPCLRTKKGCTLFCKCKGCKNPHGLRQEEKEVHKTRKRTSCEMGGVRQKGEMFLSDRGEVARCGPWTELESLILL